MSKTLRAFPADPPELLQPARPWRDFDDDDPPLLHVARTMPPETWNAEVLRAVRREAGAGPVRKHGGIDDFGVVPGTTEGAHRFYFAAHHGNGRIFKGTVVAAGVGHVKRWLRDELRARLPLVGRDRRCLAGF